MKDEYLLSLAAADIAGFIRNDLFDKYESNNIQGLDGFTLTYQDLSDDLNGLSDEIMEILKHPRKYKALLKAFAHIRNYQARSKLAD